ncbi:MAG: hypothetical protein C4293_19720 [Nitrospiraceae bacterium]
MSGANSVSIRTRIFSFCPFVLSLIARPHFLFNLSMAGNISILAGWHSAFPPIGIDRYPFPVERKSGYSTIG